MRRNPIVVLATLTFAALSIVACPGKSADTDSVSVSDSTATNPTPTVAPTTADSLTRDTTAKADTAN